MPAEHLKELLRGMKSEEDPETGPNNVGTRDRWRALAWLVQAVWYKGRITLQLGWVVTVLIPKGSGDYCGIGLLQPVVSAAATSPSTRVLGLVAAALTTKERTKVQAPVASSTHALLPSVVLM